MTAKEKAKELYDKHLPFAFYNEIAKQCSLIAVDEILKVVSLYNDTQHEGAYFTEVKNEIEKL